MISHSYISTHVADENSTIVVISLFRLQIQAHRNDAAAIAKRHTVRIPEVSRVNCPAVWIVE